MKTPLGPLIAVCLLTSCHRQWRPDPATARTHGAYFSYASFRDADFGGKDFRGAFCFYCDGVRADLSRGKLAGFRSFDGTWRGADFSGADLRAFQSFRDDLREADFRGADLRGAVLMSGDLDGALFDAATRLPFSPETARRRGMKHVE